MGHRTALVLLLLPLASAVAPAQEDAKATDLTLSRRVAEAIDRGATWLAGTQQPNGTFPSPYAAGYPMGPTGLCTLALLHSGVPRTDSAVERAIAYLRTAWNAVRKRGGLAPRVYDISVTVMALAEFGRDRRPEAGGAFVLDETDRKWLDEMVRWLVSVQQGNGAWRYPEAGYDLSNTQYALLALKEARRCGIEVPRKVFERALGHIVGAQERDGPQAPRYEERGGDGVYGAQRERVPGHDRVRGFGYVGPAAATGSMTAAGVAVAAICASEMDPLRQRDLAAAGWQAVRDGIAWLGRRFDVRQNPGYGATWHYYYLYGLERAGVLARVVYMGEHRWYAEGARYLVDAQAPDGSWRPALPAQAADIPCLPRGGNVVDQAFALLFLSRATARALGVATEEPLLDLPAGKDLPAEEFEKLLDAAFAEMDRLTPERAADRARDFALIGPRVIPSLLARLTAEAVGERARADQVLRSVTGLTFGFEAAGPDADREAAVDRWTMWYLANRDRLAVDPAGRIIR